MSDGTIRMSATENLPFPVWAEFQFKGNATEYFNIWIVNVLLTIVTLGIYSAWAKVRTESYFYGNTVVNGSSFRYTGDPLKILKGRALSVVVFALFWLLFNYYPGLILWTFTAACLAFPFVVVASTSFRMRNSMYRNIRFRFDAAYLDAYKALLFPLGMIVATTTLLYIAFDASELATLMDAVEDPEVEFRSEDAFFTIFILAAIPFIPYLMYVLRRFVVDHMHYGSAPGSFMACAWDFYKVYLKGFVLTFGLMFCLGIILAIVMGSLGLGDEIETGTALEGVEALAALVVAMVVVMYGVGFYLLGYLNSRLTNVTFNNIEIGPLLLHSTLRGRALGTLYLTNTIAILLSLGLMVPWVKIRMARYKASRTEFLAKDMAGIEAIEQSDQSAIGEELGDIFDIDIGL